MDEEVSFNLASSCDVTENTFSTVCVLKHWRLGIRVSEVYSYEVSFNSSLNQNEGMYTVDTLSSLAIINWTV